MYIDAYLHWYANSIELFLECVFGLEFRFVSSCCPIRHSQQSETVVWQIKNRFAWHCQTTQTAITTTTINNSSINRQQTMRRTQNQNKVPKLSLGQADFCGLLKRILKIDFTPARTACQMFAHNEPTHILCCAWLPACLRPGSTPIPRPLIIDFAAGDCAQQWQHFFLMFCIYLLFFWALNLVVVL